jgi:hypothetical protein
VFLLLLFSGCGRTALDAAKGRDAAGEASGTHTDASSGPSCTPGLFTLGGLPVSRFSESPRFIALGDLDGDGKLDLVATLANARKVGMVFGRGDGSFARTVELDAGGEPGAAAIGDLDGDGKNDLVVANSETVGVWLSQGDGRFATRVEYPVRKVPDQLVLADVNGDGRPDIAVTTLNSTLLSLLLNRGDGTFAPASQHELGGTPRALAAGHLNGDGLADLAVTLDRPSQAVALLFGTRDGKFISRTIDSPANAVAIGQFDGDGRPDLALSTGREVRILFNQGDGLFSAPTDYPAGPVDACGGYGLIKGDSNRDGRDDLALLNDDCENITVLRNRGDGRFADAQVHWIGTYPSHLAFGDLNGDGRDDLAVLSDYQQILIVPAQPDGSFVSDWFPATPVVSYSATLGDVDSDGRLDLVDAVGNEPFIEVRFGQADGSFSAAVRYPSKGKTEGLAIVDVSGDGARDLVYWDFSGAMGVLLRQKDGTFASAVETKLPGWPSAYAFHDLDGDRDADLVLISRNPAITEVWLSQGDGSFAQGASYASPNRPTHFAVGDFDADGKPDLGYLTQDSGEIVIALGRGNGAFATGTRHTIAGKPSSLAVGDVNGDQVLDLIATRTSPNMVSVFLGGAGLRGPWRDTPVDFSAESVLGIGDVNLDGKPDLALVQRGAMLIMLGQGDGGFGESLVYGMVCGGPMVLADLTGDGRLDVGVVQEVDGVVRWNVYRNSLCR